MPELPEVEHVRRGLTPVLHQQISKITFSDKVIEGHKNHKQTILKDMHLKAFKAGLINGEIISINRRSKYLIFEINKHDNSIYLVSHLGMSGGYFIVDTIDDIPVDNFRKHWHVQFQLNHKILVYSDIRRFGEMRLMDEAQFELFNQKIAPEPFEPVAQDYFMNRLNEKKFQNKPIKSVIMDHSVVSGCGNIYACEALFHAGILPNTMVASLNEENCIQLFKAIQRVLQEGIEHGGSTISDYRNVNGQSGQMQNRFYVYGKKQCGYCGSDIEHIVIAGRNSHYCATCQR
ncbi:bifunctional DNA-formamidopyrimidine glycosylase/DNA-(apurinic or apyrimidinic site) lyase [Macrococcus sp. DPC7161]|uniref:bifunctional DNA-formamidopyrimidine glycosylase/DNA-(apurinic or apyrimidinic site) lyase n=1 Tax=Macrococcus sp. DPC7161 TaxID=2507060 RepID=UPI00100A948A|nr:bifunctional DNA-formamidopyrimidine glycosylase/DNA-(apurinic or apyrimidinic site) lyase [Macrococcus sp. DPC7161]RXK18218.1 bifunctional DNA-formamidopyrimidine glycosylase/DNA-(apurinic or apyrimidinic site) lyase [Macrococcus sp. DPC7161]